MSRSSLVLPCERVDDLQRDGLFLIQNPELFCFGVDAVFLADFAKVKSGDRVMDLCTGNGIVPVLLSTSEASSVVGVEVMERSFDLARRNVLYNGLSDKVSVFNLDVKACVSVFGDGSFDVVTVNPPYMNDNGGFKCSSSELSAARHEVLVSFLDIVLVSKRLLRFGGRFFLVHRPSRLAELVSCMSNNGIEPKCFRFVHSFSHKEPFLVLIEGARGGKPYSRVLPPLVVYNSDGGYTDEVLSIYGRG